MEKKPMHRVSKSVPGFDREKSKLFNILAKLHHCDLTEIELGSNGSIDTVAFKVDIF